MTPITLAEELTNLHQQVADLRKEVAALRESMAAACRLLEPLCHQPIPSIQTIRDALNHLR